MAVITVSGTHTPVAKGVLLSVWTFPTSATIGSLGTILSAPNYPDKTVSARGTWATGVTITIEGSNTATYSTGTTKWSTLNDPQGTALALSTGKMEAILENPRWIRPRITARTGSLGTVVIEILSQSTKR